MDEPNQALKHILALAWNIATEPKLYWQLAPNPYSSHSLKLISERFPNASIDDIVKAIVLAEPEGKYDRDFKHLSKELQEAEVFKQSNIAIEITKHLNEFYSQNALKLVGLSEDLIYDILFKTAFKNFNLQEIEQRYSQNQRRDIKLLILNLIKKKQSMGLKPRKTFSIAAFSLLSIISFSFLILLILAKQSLVVNATNQIVPEQILSAEVQKKNSVLPVRLIIPSINVDAVVDGVGVNAEGIMEVPNDTVDVGWYKLGSSPGEVGSAVVAGHFNGINGESGVFKNLDKLKPGDKIYVVNVLGLKTTFIVRESRTFDPGFADEVFSPKDTGIHLNLITCDGSWDEIKKSYTKRLVVFSDIN